MSFLYPGVALGGPPAFRKGGGGKSRGGLTEPRQQRCPFGDGQLLAGFPLIPGIGWGGGLDPGGGSGGLITTSSILGLAYSYYVKA